MVVPNGGLCPVCCLLHEFTAGYQFDNKVSDGCRDCLTDDFNCLSSHHMRDNYGVRQLERQLMV